jgi:hypothetical protein
VVFFGLRLHPPFDPSSPLKMGMHATCLATIAEPHLDRSLIERPVCGAVRSHCEAHRAMRANRTDRCGRKQLMSHHNFGFAQNRTEVARRSHARKDARQYDGMARSTNKSIGAVEHLMKSTPCALGANIWTKTSVRRSQYHFAASNACIDAKVRIPFRYLNTRGKGSASLPTPLAVVYRSANYWHPATSHVRPLDHALS